MAAHQFQFTLPLRQRPADPAGPADPADPVPVIFDERSHQGDDIGEHGSSRCSIRYLVVLLLELQKARAHALLEVSEVSNEEKHLGRLQFLTSEFSRLLGRPGLFPSLAVKARFLSIMAADAELQFSQACKALLLKRELRNLERQSRAQLTRATYKGGSCGWENFFLNGAPGSGFTSHRTTPKSIFQVVPAVGMRILADYDREEAEIVHYVQTSKIKLDVSPAATTLMIKFEATSADQYVPDIRLPQQSRSDFIRPNPFRDDERLRLALAPPGPEPLEAFSPFINRLEAQPPPANTPLPVLNAPNACPIVTLRTWHPPSRLEDLRRLP